MTRVAKIVKGMRFVCVHPALEQPVMGTVIALTTNETKQIGLQLDGEGFHDCDGRGEPGKCIWVRPNHILTEEEYAAEEASKQQLAEMLDDSLTQDLEELEL